MMAARAAWSFFKLKKIEKRSKKKDGKKMHHHDVNIFVFGLHFESNAQVPIPTSPHPHVYVATLNLARM